jgi:lipopolysaccharide transport system ATP-binding protein
MNTVIHFDHVSKRFMLHRERARSFQDLLIKTLRHRNGDSELFWALRDIDLSVQQGEMLGLIGPNGAGKSTMLKLMTRILEPTSGGINVRGRVAALLELGTGFHPDLTGRENVFLNGSLLGFTRRDMQQRLDSIIDFAGMARFIDVPVRHYSSGMYMRLGFAIAVHSDPDILITDEVLAVGDEAFQNKCLERMSKFRDDGVTIILVSHALPVVRKLCSRAIWLSQGSIVMDGAPGAVIDSYIANVTEEERVAHDHAAPAGPAAPVVEGLADVRLLGVEMLAPDGRPRWEAQAGEHMDLRIHYNLRKDLPDAVVTMDIYDAQDQTLITGVNSYLDRMPVSLCEGEGCIDLPGLPLPLRDGQYLVSVALYSEPAPPAWEHPVAIQEKAYTLTIHSPLTGPQRRWGTGEALVESVLLCGEDGLPRAEFDTGETLCLRLRCISREPVVDPIVRVQIFDANDVLCHATNTERAGLHLGRLAGPMDVALVYDGLNLLEGEYTLSVGLWPSVDSRRPYDWHEHAYHLRVRSDYRHGGGLVALGHHWLLNSD